MESGFGIMPIQKPGTSCGSPLGQFNGTYYAYPMGITKLYVLFQDNKFYK